MKTVVSVQCKWTQHLLKNVVIEPYKHQELDRIRTFYLKYVFDKEKKEVM